MRNKVSSNEKKISITFTINSQLNEILEKLIKEKNINKSKFIEMILEDKLKNNNDVCL